MQNRTFLLALLLSLTIPLAGENRITPKPDSTRGPMDFRDVVGIVPHGVGIDVYWENVGGLVFRAVLPLASADDAYLFAVLASVASGGPSLKPPASVRVKSPGVGSGMPGAPISRAPGRCPGR